MPPHYPHPPLPIIINRRFLLTGGVGTAEPPPNPAPEWLADRCWAEACRLAEQFEAPFGGLPEAIRADPAPWRALYDSPDPARMRLPEPWAGRLDSFQRLLVIRLVRPDKLVAATQAYVLEAMGPKFTEPPPFDLDRCYQVGGAVQACMARAAGHACIS